MSDIQIYHQLAFRTLRHDVLHGSRRGVDALASLSAMVFSADGFQQRIGFVSTGNHFIETIRGVFQSAGDDTHDAAVWTRLTEGSDKSLSPVF
jgi:hypothetical protein